MAHKTLAIIAALSLAGILYLVYLALTFESPQGTRTVEIDQPVPRPVESVEDEDEEEESDAASGDSAQPRDDDASSANEESPGGLALQPIPEPQSSTDEGEEEAAEEPEPLPELNESDEFVRARLASLEMGATLLRTITPEEVIRRFVVFVDNVARDELPQLAYPVPPPEEEMPVREVDNNLYEMEPAAHRRFDDAVDTLLALDVDNAVEIYRRVEPLLQEAYAELGYGDADFNETIIEAIDTVLEAETVEGPYQLIRPSVHYEFAESSIEAMSPVSKQLMRLGPENTERLRDRLRDYRDRLAAL